MKTVVLYLFLTILSFKLVSQTKNGTQLKTKYGKIVDLGKEPLGTIRYKDNFVLYKGRIFSGILIETDYMGHKLLYSEYKDGKVNGKYELYGANGKLKEKYSSFNGLRNGLYEKYFYPSGKINIRANYKNGKIDGISEIFFESGKTKSKGNYKDGIEITYIEYWSNGNPLLTRNYEVSPGLRKCLFQRFRENGVLENTGMVINDTSDVIDGKNYDENGKLIN